MDKYLHFKDLQKENVHCPIITASMIHLNRTIQKYQVSILSILSIETRTALPTTFFLVSLNIKCHSKMIT